MKSPEKDESKEEFVRPHLQRMERQNEHGVYFIIPVLHRPRGVSKDSSYLWATHALRHQQYSVEAVIIARFVGSADLVLQSQSHGSRIGDGESLRSSIETQPTIMRNKL